MLRTLTYILGTLALSQADLTHQDGFYRLFLPMFGLGFLIFLLWQILFYVGLNNFSDDDNYSLFDLVSDIYDLRYDIQEQGLLPTFVHLAQSFLELACLFLSVFYALDIMFGWVNL